MGKRKRTLKRTIVLFWKGLTGIIAATAEWFTVILGMKDESKYGKFIRRVVGGCFAFIMFVFACAGGNALYEFVYKKVNAAKYLDDSYYDSQYLSRNATYYSRAYETDGYVETRDGKKTIKGIHWISNHERSKDCIVLNFRLLINQNAKKRHCRHSHFSQMQNVHFPFSMLHHAPGYGIIGARSSAQKPLR